MNVTKKNCCLAFWSTQEKRPSAFKRDASTSAQKFSWHFHLSNNTIISGWRWGIERFVFPCRTKNSRNLLDYQYVSHHIEIGSQAEISLGFCDVLEAMSHEQSLRCTNFCNITPAWIDRGKERSNALDCTFCFNWSVLNSCLFIGLSYFLFRI